MRIYEFKSDCLDRAPLGEVFDFFSRAENLERLTPAFVGFRILTPLPIDMRAGSVIEYTIRLFGVPMRWLTEIVVWEPMNRFVDVQRKGPYAKWEHEHLFESEGDGTRMCDTVRYAVPGWVFAPILHALFVRRQVERIFGYRSQAIERIFAPSAGSPTSERRAS